VIASRLSLQACPIDTLYTHWNPFVVVRFMRNGRLLMPSGGLTERVSDDCGLQKVFRFGQLYFIQHRPNVENPGRTQCQMLCVQGHDTMRLVLYPYYNSNVFYDAIPFRPGTYLLHTPWKYPGDQVEHYGRLRIISFTKYYTKHEDELAEQNVFANVHFSKPYTFYRNYGDSIGTPATPARIFATLLQQTSYIRMRDVKLIPVHLASVKEHQYPPKYIADDPADTALVENP
jgi:hypothetical protein